MALNSTQDNTVFKLLAGMFNLAPTADLYAGISPAYEASGGNLSALAQELSFHPMLLKQIL